MLRTYRWTAFVLALILSAPVAAASAAKKAPRLLRQVVFAGEGLAASGASLDENFQALLRRLEVIAGWAPGSTGGRAFVRPREALDYIRKHKVAFAVLPIHQFVEGFIELKFEVLGRVVGLEGHQQNFWGIARPQGRPKPSLNDDPGLKLAMTETYDLKWLNTLFEGEYNIRAHFPTLIEVPDGKAAVEAVLSSKADVALLREADFNEVKARVGKDGDLRWVYSSGGMPTPPIVAVGKFVKKADRDALAAALPKLCQEGAGEICARMGVVFTIPGDAKAFNNILKKYIRYGQ